MVLTSVDLLASIRWTFAEHIAGCLEGNPLAQSYGRGITQALANVEARIRAEDKVLLAEIADLREVLTAVAGRLPDAASEQVNQALRANADTIEYGDKESVMARVYALREALIVAIRLLPKGDRSEIRGYIARQLERDAQLEAPLTAMGVF